MHIIDRIYAIILSFIFLFLTICNVLTLWVVGIEGLCTVAVFQVGALLELVIAYPVHIVITVGLVAANMVKQIIFSSPGVIISSRRLWLLQFHCVT